MMFGSRPDTLFEQLAQGTPAITSGAIRSFRSHGQNLLRFVFGNDRAVLFPSVTEAKPYQQGLFISKDLLDVVQREFSTLCCFADGTQLKTRDATLVDIKASPDQTRMKHYRAEHGGAQFSLRHPDDQDIVLREELKRIIFSIIGRPLSEEQLANFCSLSVQHGNNPALKLLSLIKTYMTTQMNMGIQGEKAFINPSQKKEGRTRTRADDKADAIRPRCTIKFRIYQGVLGFEQILHTGYTQVIENVDDEMPAQNNEDQCMNILIQVFVPLAVGLPVVFLALVVTAERRLQKVMRKLFDAINSGELGRVNLRATVTDAIAQAPKPTFVYETSIPKAFGLSDSFMPYYHPGLLSLTQHDLQQAAKDMPRDIEVPEGVSFSTPADDPPESKQEQLLDNLRKMGFSHLMKEQLLNLCILVSQNTHNRLKTLATGIQHLFHMNDCRLSEPNKKNEAQHAIMPANDGFIYTYYVYYTQVQLPATAKHDGICDSRFFKLLPNKPLISVYISMIVPLCERIQMQPMTFRLASHVAPLDQYVRKVSEAINAGGMVAFYNEQVKSDRSVGKSRLQTRFQMKSSPAHYSPSTPASARPQSADSGSGATSASKRNRVFRSATGATPAMRNFSIASAQASPQPLTPDRLIRKGRQLFNKGSNESIDLLASPLAVGSGPDSLAASQHSLFGSDGSGPSSLFNSPNNKSSLSAAPAASAASSFLNQDSDD